jgi:N4-gp56 family major capsid protein
MAANMQYGTSNMGGYLAPDETQKDFIKAFEGIPKFRQFAKMIDKAQAAGGKTLINKISTISTTGAVVAETSTIPLHAATISQVTLTLYEYANAVDSSLFLQLVGSTPIESVIGRVLADDAVKTLEQAAETAMNGFDYRYVATSTSAGSWTTNGTATATNTSVMNAYHVGVIVDYLKSTVKAPFFDGISYMGICTVKCGRNIKDDSSFESWKLYGDPMALLDGEIGKLDGVRFVEETLVDGFDNAIGSGTLSGEAYIFGRDCLYELNLIPEHVRQDLTADFGRQLQYAWYAVTGFGVVNEYGMKWDSAA